MHRRTSILRQVCVAVLVCVINSSATFPQSFLSSVLSGGKPEAAAPAQPELAELSQSQVDAEIERVEAEIGKVRGAAVNAEVPPVLQGELQLWKKVHNEVGRVDAVVADNLKLLQRTTELQSQLADARARGVADKPPHSYLLVDELMDQHYVLRQRQKGIETDVELARDKCDRVRNRLDALQRRVRLAQESLKLGSAKADEDLATSVRLFTIEAQWAAQHLRLALAELKHQELLKQVVAAEFEFVEERLKQIRPKAEFTPAALERILQQLAVQAAQAQEELKRVQVALQEVEVQQQSASHEEYLKTLQLRQRGLQASERFLQDGLDRLAEKRTLWTRRFQVITHVASLDEVQAWGEESRNAQKDLDRAKRLLTALIANARGQLTSLESRPPAAAATPDIAQLRQHQINDLRLLLETHEKDLASVEGHRRLHSKLREEMRDQSALETAAALMSNSWHRASQVWNYEIVNVEGSPITVKKIVLGIALLIGGVYVSRMLAWGFARMVLPRFGVVGNAARPLQTITFYVLFLTCALFALRLVSVPLTAFTVIGGALAIGVGVGSQSIANNFISGLILLAERPVRVGDHVEIDGVFGVVEDIGPRSTRIRTSKNLEMILPNSHILERNLTNWTLSDDRIRSSLAVGVAYGSSTTQVAELLHRAACESPHILQDPEPRVLFSEFGESALQFEVQFSLSLSSPVDRRSVESELRFAIDALFREAGIQMPFPQRDIHFNTANPITVQIARPSEPESDTWRKSA